MTQETSCPACNAPLTVPPEAQHMHCAFCNAEFDVVREDDQVHLVLTNQPQPQKDELSQAGQTVIQSAAADAAQVIAAANAAPQATFAAQVDPVTTDDDPWAAGPAVIPDQVIPAGGQASSGSRTPWIIGGVSLVVILCLLCLCLAIAGTFFFNMSGSSY